MTTEDRIYLRGLKCQCIIGFIDWERQVPQTVELDLEFPCDCARAAAQDAVADTVDYKQVAKRVLAFVDANGDLRGTRRPDAELDAVVERQRAARALPHLCGHGHSAGRSQTTASGGSVTVALNGWSCQPGPSAATLPMFPMPPPV